MSLLPVDRLSGGARSVASARRVLAARIPTALPEPLVIVRLAVFVFVLLLVVSAAWMVGRATNPPVPIPDLPRPSVFGGPGSVGHNGAPLVHPGAP